MIDRSEQVVIGDNLLFGLPVHSGGKASVAVVVLVHCTSKLLLCLLLVASHHGAALNLAIRLIEVTNTVDLHAVPNSGMVGCTGACLASHGVVVVDILPRRLLRLARVRADSIVTPSIQVATIGVGIAV